MESGQVCAICKVVAGRAELDHIVPLKKIWKKEMARDEKVEAFFVESNLQVLCRGCHIQKTREENRVINPAASREWAQFTGELYGNH